MSSELLTELQTGDTLRVAYPSVFVDRADEPPPPPDPESVTFIFITDPHVGRLNTFLPGEPQSLIEHVLSLAPAFVIVNGDCTENGTLAEMQAFLDLWDTDIPLYFLPGNHDEDKLYEDPPPNSYTNYIALINTWQFAFDVLNYRLIGFTSNVKRDAPFQGAGYLDAATKTFLSTEAAALDGKNPILFTHFPISDIFGANIRDGVGGTQSGQKHIFDLFASASGGLAMTGHRHYRWWEYDPTKYPYASPVVSGFTEVNGPCFGYNAYNNGKADGGYNVVTLTNESIHIAAYRARPPFDLLTEFTL